MKEKKPTESYIKSHRHGIALRPDLFLVAAKYHLSDCITKKSDPTFVLDDNFIVTLNQKQIEDIYSVACNNGFEPIRIQGNAEVIQSLARDYVTPIGCVSLVIHPHALKAGIEPYVFDNRTTYLNDDKQEAIPVHFCYCDDTFDEACEENDLCLILHIDNDGKISLSDRMIKILDDNNIIRPNIFIYNASNHQRVEI